MAKIWLKGLAFYVTAAHLDELRDSEEFPGTSMKEDEAFKKVCKLYPDQAPDKKKGKAKKEND